MCNAIVLRSIDLYEIEFKKKVDIDYKLRVFVIVEFFCRFLFVNVLAC